MFAMGNGQVEPAVPALAAVTAAAVGSLVPDIDHPQAWISNRIPATLIAGGLVFLLWFGLSKSFAPGASATDIGAALFAPLLDLARPLIGWAFLALALGIALLVLARAVAAVTEHRGPTHSLSVGVGLMLVAVVGFAFAGQPLTLGLWFGWGYLSHLLADLLTPMGCPALLWPLGSGDPSALQGMGLRLMATSASHMTRKTAQAAHITAGSKSERGQRDHGLSRPVGPNVLRPQGNETDLELRPAVERSPSATHLHVAVVDGVETAASESAAAEPSAEASSRVCPKCGAALVLRKARRGIHAGDQFYGCSRYPKCYYIGIQAG